MTTSPDSVTYPASINEIVGPTEAAPWEATLRPTNPWQGLFGFDTVSDRFEFYDGTSWKHPLFIEGGTITGNLRVDGTLGVGGATTLDSTLAVAGNFAIATNKFTVTASSGNTAVGGTLVVTGAGTVNNLFRLNPGTLSITGAYSAAASPFDFRFGMADVPVASLPGTQRTIMQTIISPDLLDSTGGQTLSANLITSWTDYWYLGAFNQPVATSWDGGRTLRRFEITDRSPPRSATDGPPGTFGTTAPALNVLLSSAILRNYRGGNAPEEGHARGNTFVYYGQVRHIAEDTANGTTGARNLHNSRLMELAWFSGERTSAMIGAGITLQVEATDGVLPPYGFTAYGFKKNAQDAPGWRIGFGHSGHGLGGMDRLRGALVAYYAGVTDYQPKLRDGVNIFDLEFSGRAMAWPGGDISGGLHSAVDTGRLRVGTSYLTPTTTGASLRVAGYVGQPVEYVFTDGVDFTQTNPIIEVVNNMIGEDDYGGVYRFTQADTATNTFGACQVLTRAVYDGGSPPASVDIYLRSSSGGRVEYTSSEASTETTHYTQLTASITDFYVGRYLRYMSGDAEGESQIITAYDASTGVLTTTPFSVVPSGSVQLIVSPTFILAFPTTENTVLNGWQYTLNGGTGTVTKQGTGPSDPRRMQVIGDGTNAAAGDQEVAFSSADDGAVEISGYGNYTIKIGSTRGGDDYLNEVIVAPVGSETEYIVHSYTFYATSTAVHIRIENTATDVAAVRTVKLAQGAGTIVNYVRAAVETAPLTVTQSWTERNALSIQPDGGGTTFGGEIEMGTAGPTITTGAGVPAATEPVGSMYLRTGGGVGTTLYVSQGAGTWNAVAGV